MSQIRIGHFSFLIGCFFSSIVLAQNLIIIHEYGINECIANTLDCTSSLDGFPPHGLGACSGMFLIALYQKAAPIVVPAPLWDNILEHKKIFDDFMRLKKNKLFSRYGKTNRFSSHQKIDEFQGACRYIENLYQAFLVNCNGAKSCGELEKKLWLDPLFDKKNAPYYLKDLDSPLWNEVHLYLLCAHVPIQNYAVKMCMSKIECLFYVLFPKSSVDYAQWFHVPGETGGAMLDKKNESKKGKYETALVPLLESLLKSKKDAQWIIYLLGHGSFSTEARHKIDNELQELRHWQRKKEDYGHDKEKWKAQKKAIEHDIDEYKKKSKKNEWYATNVHLKRMLKHNYEACCKNIALCHSQQKICENNISITQYNIDVLESANTIAGITHGHFRFLLNFLRDQVSTQLLYYSSCSAGGKNFVDPYHDDQGKPITVSYVIISDTLTEAPSSCQCPSLEVRYYSNRDHYCYYSISPKAFMNFQKTDTVPLKTCYDFSTFFSCARALRCKKNVKALFQSMSHLYRTEDEQPKDNWLSVHVKKMTSWWNARMSRIMPQKSSDKVIKPREISNLASIRMPFSSTFCVVDFYNRFLALPAQNTQKMRYVDDALDVLFL